MYDILFKEQSIGKLSDITVDGDLWFSAYVEFSEYGETLVGFFTVLMNENSKEEDFNPFEPDLLCNDYWSMVDLTEKHHHIEIPALHFDKNIVMWRKINP